MRLHSIIKLVTNSSSETFVTPACGALESAITVFNEIFAVAGIPLEATDVFDFEYEMSDMLACTNSIEVDFVNENYQISPPLETEQQCREWLVEYAKEHNNEDVEVCDYDDDRYKCALDLRIVVKEQFRNGLPEGLGDKNFAYALQSLFDAQTWGIN
jgi:hypothetical protein